MYRELQKSVPGLLDMYDAIGEALASSLKPNDRMLVVGGGGGREIELLHQKNLSPALTIVDPSQVNLAQAQAVAKKLGFAASTRFIKGSVESIPPDKMFDCATAILVFSSMRDWRQERELLISVGARLKLPGRFILAELCLDDTADLRTMIARYRTHATELGTEQKLIELETDAVLACRDRSRSRLERILREAGLRVTRKLTQALWYASFEVQPKAAGK